MSIGPVSSICRAATRKDDESLNILTAPTHERYESLLARTGHNFYAYGHESFKPGWNEQYAKIPNNYTILAREKGTEQLPKYVDFDLILSQNKFGQFQILSQIARALHLPLVSLEHTLPVPYWNQATFEGTKQMRGDINVYISEYSVGKWEWEDKNDTYVIRHALDSNIFKPDNNIEAKNHILTVANDYIGRDWCLNFQQYQRVTQGLPTFPIGDTKGFSQAAPNLIALIKSYQSSRIFLNTAHISPIPTSLLEAMSCGCACVSVKASEIPYYIQHGVNGFLANNDQEMRQYLELLLNDEKLAKELGQRARETIIEKCNPNRFVSEWNDLFRRASKVIFKG